jgi:hypothetical protein
MTVYLTFKQKDKWVAQRNGSYRNDCRLCWGDLIMATGSHDHITRLFTQFTDPAFTSEYTAVSNPTTIHKWDATDISNMQPADQGKPKD